MQEDEGKALVWVVDIALSSIIGLPLPPPSNIPGKYLLMKAPSLGGNE